MKPPSSISVVTSKGFLLSCRWSYHRAGDLRCLWSIAPTTSPLFTKKLFKFCSHQDTEQTHKTGSDLALPLFWKRACVRNLISAVQAFAENDTFNHFRVVALVLFSRPMQRPTLLHSSSCTPGSFTQTQFSLLLSGAVPMFLFLCSGL